ncbi:autoinducer binding domain-containing protein [Pelagibacterium sp. H642]|uniref:autoinducer binding domain-containing protein n=1 Tax=Pelagibacterium sp. H642 TaxID=1881069 RepID=UPI00281693E2|nr:autoinducer binding domain-containing protein [Pelagibacterium sp. H642]WMT92555.1 autoinducer binding domain-containing protein [Pelagibacterium sp. H642]
MPAVHALDRGLETLIDEMETLRDRTGVRQALERFAKSSGFDRFAFVCAGGPEITGLSNYDQQWQLRYLERNLNSFDPVVRRARQVLHPFAWSRHEQRFRDLSFKAFFDEAADFGIRSGISMPIPASYGRFAMLTLASGEAEAWRHVAVENPIRAAAAVACVHLNLGRLFRNDRHDPKPILSGRQSTCLTWSSYGKTTPEIAALLGIRENTVRFYLVEARDRLGAANITHAVRIAVERGLI